MKLATLCLTTLSLPLVFAAVAPCEAPNCESYIPANIEVESLNHDLKIRAPIITPTLKSPSTKSAQAQSSSVPASSRAASSRAASTEKASSSSHKSEKSTIKSTPSVTKLVGSFTAGGAIFAETSQSGYVFLDGKTLSVGGPNAIIAGEVVTEAKKGLLVNGTPVKFVTPNPSSSIPARMSSSVPASSAAVASSVAPVTKSVAKPAPTSTTSTGGAAVATVGVVANAAAVIGVVVGALIL